MNKWIDLLKKNYEFDEVDLSAYALLFLSEQPKPIRLQFEKRIKELQNALIEEFEGES